VFALTNWWSGARTFAATASIPGAPAVELDHVTCSFPGRRGEVLAIADVSLRIERGEFVCILGPSGSGKSTVLNLVAGLLKPSQGRVHGLAGDIPGPGPDRAVVFQDAALFPWLTLQQNVEYPLSLRRVPRAERAAESERLLRLVQLWKFRERHPHELSGGMRQRGAIARALAGDPQVLLMDEPFGALDAQTRELLHAELERVFLATRKTVLFVTHSVLEAIRLADRVVLMGTRPGRVLKEIRVDLPRPRHPADERVAELVVEAGASIAREVDKVAREEAERG